MKKKISKKNAVIIAGAVVAVTAVGKTLTSSQAVTGRTGITKTN